MKATDEIIKEVMQAVFNHNDLPESERNDKVLYDTLLEVINPYICESFTEGIKFMGELIQKEIRKEVNS